MTLHDTFGGFARALFVYTFFSGAELESKFLISDLGRSLASLDMEDVMPASQGSVSDDGLEVEMITFDGLRVTLRSVKEGERTLARLQADFDEQLVSPEFFSDGEQSEGESEFLVDADAIRKDVARLNREWEKWIYVLPDYRAKYMSVRKEEMIKAPEKKE